MFTFNYRQISDDLISELQERALNEHSVLLLGPRYGGKRYVMDQLCSLIERAEMGPVVKVRWLSDRSLCTSQQVRNLLEAAVHQANPNLKRPRVLSEDDPFQMLKVLAGPGHGASGVKRGTKPPFLFAANVDAMSHHLARRFLQDVMTLVEARRLVAVLSGENDFHGFVHGSNSEFTCAERYVLQGHALDKFLSFLQGYLKHLRIDFYSLEEAGERLWEITGGNLYILRVILWSIVQKRDRSEISDPIKPEDIPDTVNLVGIPGVYGAQIFQHATKLIARDPGSWKDLEALIENAPVPVTPNAAPRNLELSGIAKRSQPGGQATLGFSSPMMAAFVRSYYDSRRFGDLYASLGRWEDAFIRYAQLVPEERVRPSSTDDRAELEATIGNLCSSLYESVASEDTRGINAAPIDVIRTRFANGCRYILGFQEVTFWQQDTLSASPGWEHDLIDSDAPSARVMEQIRKLLPERVDTQSRPRVLALPDKNLEKYAIAALLPTTLNKQNLVIISDFANRIVMSHEREDFIRRILSHFIGAYRHAVEVDNLQTRQRTHSRLEQTISSLYASLGARNFDVPSLLRLAAKGLRAIGYRRVLFCLVDKENKEIVGEVDDSDDPTVDVALDTKWSLEQPGEDLQPHVINTKRPKIVEDAAREPLANKRVVRAAGMKALAIVPILNSRGEAIGTIHVEKSDRSVPKREDVEDLQAFGRQLAVAIEQCARLNMLEAVLDKLPDPITILDTYRRPRYHNDEATKFFGGQSGWRRRSRDPEFPELESLPENISQPISESLMTGSRRDTYIEGLTSDPNYVGQVITDVIQDWRKRTVGLMLRIQDRTSLHQYIEAPQAPAEAPDAPEAIRKILEATALLGHKWGRMYLVRKSKDGTKDEFVSRWSYGNELPSIEEDFNSGKIVLAPRSVPRHYDWRCIEEERPIVFCWNDDAPTGHEVTTAHGIKAVNWKDPQQHPAIRKKVGDFWMDFPLIHEHKPIGKVCLQLDENLRQEDFALLTKLSVRFAAILAAKLKRDEDFDLWEQLIRKSGAEKAFETFTHNLATRLASLYVIQDQYEVFAEEYPAVRELNDDLDEIVDYVDTTLRRAQVLLGPVSSTHLKSETVNVGKLLLKTLRQNMRPKTWKLEVADDVPDIPLDAGRFTTTLLEFIRNSHDVVSKPTRLRLEIKISRCLKNPAYGIEIRYRDNGPGIPEEYRSRIFDDFFSYRPNQEIPSTGLGMSFAKRVIEAHGGQIVYSSPMSGYPGAEFEIYLPGAKTVPEEGGE